MTVSENDFFQLIESLPYGVYIVKPDRTIVYWNREAECITGYGAEEMVGRRCPDTELNHMDEEGTPLCKTYCPFWPAWMRSGRRQRSWCSPIRRAT